MSTISNKIRHNDLKGVSSSIAGGASLSRKDRRGNTPLHIAAEMDHVEIAGKLIAEGAPLTEENAAGKNPAQVRPGTQTSSLIEEAILTAQGQTPPQGEAPRRKRGGPL